MQLKTLSILSMAFLLSSGSFAKPRKFPSKRIQPKNTSKTLKNAIQISKEERLSIDSGWYAIDENQVEFQATYNSFDMLKHERIRHRNISKKAFKMIKEAQNYIFASVFLFDNMHGTNSPKHDVVEDFTTVLINKKKNNPDIKIAVILDPLNRAYSRRVSDSVAEFNKNGIDVFYSDLVPTAKASKVGLFETFGHLLRGADILSGGFLGSLFGNIASLVPMAPKKLDGHQIDAEVAFGAALMKANHRKILVTDNSEGEFEAMVTSANPHNGSDDSTNTSLTVKGDLAKRIFNILRQDLGQSLVLQSRLPLKWGPSKYALISDQNKKEYGVPAFNGKKLKRYMEENFPILDINKQNEGSKVSAKFVSEIEIKRSIIKLLEETDVDDKVRIQMFYLSEPDVVNAIAKVAAQEGRTIPVQLILDPSKDAFNSIKDGTPNRQVAHYLMRKLKNINIEVRWYATHGEQNHAKAMSITNEATEKFLFTTGSCNWTGKNMRDINMESNLIVKGSSKINGEFDSLFDKMWNNSEDGVQYTQSYEAYDLITTRKLVLGYKKYKKLSDSEKRDIEILLDSQVKNFMVKENIDFIENLANLDVEKWIEDKVNKDTSSKIRALSYVIGKTEVEQSKQSQEKWEKKYMRKWAIGEGLGYSAW